MTPAGAAAERQPPGDPGGGTADKVRPELQQRFDTQATTDFWVRFEARADLTEAGQVAGWAERGTRVAGALQDTAAASQTAVRKRLDSAGVDYRAFWATNALYVPQGSITLAEELAARPEVDALYATPHYQVPRPAAGETVREGGSIEWGIADINADDVWTEYGVTGTGIVVASIDAGVQYDHPALVQQYRGNNGDGTFDHDYNWFDAARTTPSGRWIRPLTRPGRPSCHHSSTCVRTRLRGSR